MSQTEVKLQHPLKDGGTDVSVLKLRRPKVRDMMVMDEVEGNLQKSVRMISQLSDLPVAVIEEMDAADFNKASEVVEAFLG